MSKFHLNWTVNEPVNVVLQKLCKPKKMVAPSAQKWEKWRLAGLYYHRAVPVPRKLRKI